jgi:hypothetical protein
LSLARKVGVLGLVIACAGCTAILDLDRDFQESPSMAGDDGGGGMAPDATSGTDSAMPESDANGGRDTATVTDTGTDLDAAADTGIDSGRRRDSGKDSSADADDGA